LIWALKVWRYQSVSNLNLKLKTKHYPNLDFAGLQKSIENKVAGKIHKYLKECGYLKEESQ
jgi:hypothetical protein